MICGVDKPFDVDMCDALEVTSDFYRLKFEIHSDPTFFYFF